MPEVPEPITSEIGFVNTTDAPIGFATKAGTTVGSSALVLAIVAFLTGDRSEQTLGTLSAGAVGVIILGITLAGRYIQAKAKIAATTAPRPLGQIIEGVAGHLETQPLLGAPVDISREVPAGSIPPRPGDGD